MNVLGKVQEGGWNAPAAVYRATFEGVRPFETDKPKMGRGGKPMEPGVIWEFRITAGEFAGKVISRVTAATPTTKNACGTFIEGLRGRPLVLGEQPDVSAYVGQQFLVTVGKRREGDGTYPTGVCRDTPSANGTPAAVAPPSAAPAGPPPPPPSFWVMRGPGDIPLMSSTELHDFIAVGKHDPATVRVCPADSKEWTTAAAVGFSLDPAF
jgi:hypothetical protein